MALRSAGFHVIIPLRRLTEIHCLTLREAAMRMANGILVIVIFVFSLSSAASAQVLNDVIIGAVGGDPPCHGLRGRPNGQTFYGPSLALLCPDINASVANFGAGQVSAS